MNFIMKKYLFLLLAALPLFLHAQEDDKYLAGAVTTVDERVSFNRIFNVPNLSETQIYDTMLKWSQNRFQTNEKDKNWGRVLYFSKEKGQIACKGDEYIVFADKALSLDRAKINYRVTILISPGKCDMAINGITYDYEEQKLTAEEWITDENALNKEKTKLLYGAGKFRKKTIDLADNLFEEAQKALGISALSAAPAAQAVPVTPVTVSSPNQVGSAQSPMPGYREITPEQIPQNAIQLMSANTIGFAVNYKDVFNTVMVKANWGGLGYLFDHAAIFCFFAEQTNEQINKADTYALKFYGTNQTEPWMIIECKRLTNEAIQVNNSQMIAGEILNVWIK